MKKRRKFTAVLSLLLCCIMVLGLLPGTAHAASAAEIVVYKTDADGNPLAGAVFSLTKADNSGTPYTAVSDENGVARLVGMEEGEYILKEEMAPDGYICSDDSYSLIVRGSDVYFKSDEQTTELGDLYDNGEPLVFVNEKLLTFEFTVKKTDAEGNPLSGATFALTGTGNSYGKDYQEVSDQDGIATFDVPEGTYTLTEAEAPAGYIKSADSYEIAIWDKIVFYAETNAETDGLEYNIYEQVTFVNEKEPVVQIPVKKTDAEGNPLSGAVFALTGTGNYIDKNFTAVSGQDGIATFDVPEGFYTLTEETAPDGYIKSDDSYEIAVWGGKAYFYTEGSAQTEYTDYEQVIFVNEKEPEVILSVPFVKEVVQTGTKAPGKATFRFEIVSDRNTENAGIRIISDTVTTDGKGEVKGELKFAVPAGKLEFLAGGFYIREVQENADGWTYSKAVYLVMPYLQDEELTAVNVFGFFEAEEDPEGGYRISTQIPLNELRFVNSYNKAEEPVKSTNTPVTGDHTNPAFWMLLFVGEGGAMALWLKKKYGVSEK